MGPGANIAKDFVLFGFLPAFCHNSVVFCKTSGAK